MRFGEQWSNKQTLAFKLCTKIISSFLVVCPHLWFSILILYIYKFLQIENFLIVKECELANNVSEKIYIYNKKYINKLVNMENSKKNLRK